MTGGPPREKPDSDLQTSNVALTFFEREDAAPFPRPLYGGISFAGRRYILNPTSQVSATFATCVKTEATINTAPVTGRIALLHGPIFLLPRPASEPGHWASQLYNIERGLTTGDCEVL